MPAEPKPRRTSRIVAACALALAAGGLSLVALPLAAPALATMASQAQEARPGVVYTVDGKTLEGVVTEFADEVRIDANGIVTTLPRAAVRTIEYGTARERLEKRLAELPEDDLSGRLRVGEEALAAGELDLAQDVGQRVLQRSPGNDAANRLLDRVSRQRQLDSARGSGVRPGQNTPGPRVAPSDRAPDRAIAPGQVPALSPEQINLIRQVELQPADATRSRARPRFENDVLRRYVQDQKGLEFRQFNTQNDVQKALTLIAAGEPYQQDVIINNDPLGVLEYRRDVEQFVLNGCATSGCHGGAGAGNNGGFVLYPAPRDEPTSYTNFFVLNTYVRQEADPAGGAFGGGPLSRRMIDREKPDESLLLNYMLPPDRAPVPHPTVEGYNGIVPDVNNRNFQATRNWIGNVLDREAGRYYAQAAGNATTQPAEGLTQPTPPAGQ